MTDTVVIAEDSAAESGYRFSWGLALAGGVAATAVTFFLLTLGAGFGLLLVHPEIHGARSLPPLLAGGAIYFLAAQAFGFAVGGHLAGRLLEPQLETRRQEDFRAGAHGLVSWAVAVVATLVVVILAGLVAGSSSASPASLYGASRGELTGGTALVVDRLFRPEGRMLDDGSVPAREEAGRLVDQGFAQGNLSDDDRARLTALTASQAGLSQKAASDRVSQVEGDARHAAEIARKTASYTSLWIALSLLLGAIIAAAAAIYAREEDDREAARV
jgi:hypothetical protein